MPEQLWEVVGGADKGGILVRDGQSTASKQLPERLSTGALLQEVELVGERLNYKLVTGTGPPRGWISIKLPGKDLAVRFDADDKGAGKSEENGADGGTGASLTCAERCSKEQSKPAHQWQWVTMEQCKDNEKKKAKGIFYGIEFPWTAALLQEMGPAWLTKACRTVGSIPAGSKVKKIKDVKEHIGGGACSKIIFDVEWEQGDGLHTKLFAKIPFPLEGKTMSDRLASSVNQQCMDVGEINVSRLLEAVLPFRVPKFYFGDVSNETTNFILITERIPFGQKDGVNTMDPAYDKMKDWELKGPQEEYYYSLIRIGAKMAGMYKAEKLAPMPVMDKFFEPSCNRPPEHWGMGPHNTGIGESEFKMKIKMGGQFIEETGRAIFPDFVNADFIKTYKWILTVVNAYNCEINWWCNRDPAYVAWSHGNLNVDNVFFWRTPENQLDVGVLDWGGARTDSMGWKLWWWLYCCEYEYLDAHLDGMLDLFIKEYQEHGGPLLDKEELRWQFTLSALSQGVGLLGAVPQIYRMCSKKEWPTIKDRKDPRIQKNVDGKNTLRVYIGTFINIVNMMQHWGLAAKLDKWVDTFTATTGIPRKQIVVPEA